VCFSDTDTFFSGTDSYVNGDETAAGGKSTDDAVRGNTNRLFEFHVVNSYGYNEVDKLPDDGTPLKFESMVVLFNFFTKNWNRFTM
jgi:hypothetical protein